MYFKVILKKRENEWESKKRFNAFVNNSQQQRLRDIQFAIAEGKVIHNAQRDVILV